MTWRSRKAMVALAVGAVLATTTTGSTASADDNGEPGVQNTLREELTGYEETPVALSTTGSGRFRVKIDEAQQQISYQLSYAGLEGTVTQAHIHFGAIAQSGGISVFLCTNAGNGPAGTQACPAAPAAVTGTITPADIIGPAGQGITAGQFSEVIGAIRAGATYVNVHSTMYPGGEIRAQIGHNH